MMHSQMRQFGKVTSIVFDFPEVDDILPMHSHTEADIHITIIARGSFKVHGDGWEMTAKAGDVIDWEVGQVHELIALEPNSRFVNYHFHFLNHYCLLQNNYSHWYYLLSIIDLRFSI